MFADLSNFHHPLTDVFTKNAESADFRLSDEQISFFNENGYLTGVKILNDEQIEFLRNELSELMKPEQAEDSLWYEFNLNESADKSKTLFHALGAWRISEALQDLLWPPAFSASDS